MELRPWLLAIVVVSFVGGIVGGIAGSVMSARPAKASERTLAERCYTQFEQFNRTKAPQ